MASPNGQSALLAHADGVRREASSALGADRRASLGQFMTPASVAAFMAAMFDLRARHVRLLDAGAGVGSLTAAFVAEACRRPHRPEVIEATAVEFEPEMLAHLRVVLRTCEREGRNADVRFVGRVAYTDFLGWAVGQLDTGLFGSGVGARFNTAILNPPYRKIHSKSRERLLLRAAGIETSNLYTAFVALTVKLLEPRGELVAITPRSFCNGPYFKPFRELLLGEMALLRVHVFETRDRAFHEDDVLQENVIFHARKGAPRGRVLLSTSATPDSKVHSRSVAHDEVVSPGDPDAFIHLPVADKDAHAATVIRALPCGLQDLGLQVSTGRVVDFRAREFLRKDPGPRTVPLIYPAHFDRGYVSWPKSGGRKPNALADVAASADLMVPRGTYVLTKRFTSKEERRRVVAAVFDDRRLPDADRVGFENHVNYFHANGKGLPKVVARGLAAYLNSSVVDTFFRQFNGHTQVNAADLRGLRYPSLDDLEAMGRRVGESFPDQEGVDGIVGGALPSAPKVSAR